MTSIWIVLGPALLLMFIGTRIRPRGSFRGWEFPWGPATDANAFGRTLFLVGSMVAVVACYAGFKGPVQLGSIELPAFKTTPGRAFDSMINDPVEVKPKPVPKPVKIEYENALAYARDKIGVSGKFHGEGGLRFRGEVYNMGDRKISYIVLLLESPGKKTGGLRLNGPFPVGGKRVKFNTPVPKDYHILNNRLFIIKAGY